MHDAIALALLLIVLPGLLLVTAPAGKADDTSATIIGMERAALDRWGKGDPDGFLEISDSDIVYFDPFQARRLDGIEAMRKLYADVRGKIRIDRYEILDPKVQVSGDIAILTFNFVSHGSEGEMRWNTTEVYRRRAGQWRIIHTHWSLTQPTLAK